MKNKSLLFILLMALFAPFALHAQKALPYSYGFENNNLAAEGWTLISSDANTGIHTSAKHTGNYGFRFDYEEPDQYLVSPQLTGTENGVYVSFYYRNLDDDYPESFQVGYSTGSNDPTTFIYGDTYTIEDKQWTQYEAIFPEGTKYVAVKYIFMDAFYLYLDDFSFDVPSAFPKPTDLVASLTAGDGTVATLSWTELGTATNWVLETATNESFTAGLQTYNVSNTPSVDIEGLTPEQTYYARVKADYGEGNQSDYSDVISFIPTNTIGLTVNDNQGTNQYVPFYGNKAYYGTHSQFIIPASDLADIRYGQITKLTFYGSKENLSWVSENGAAAFEIYLAHIGNTEFESTNFMDWSMMTLVYTGGVEVNNFKMEFTLDTPFTYNGGNLIIGFNEIEYGGNASIYWEGKFTSANTSIYKYRNSLTTNYTYNYAQFLPKITFTYYPSTYFPSFTKDIVAYNNGTSGYYLIASPIDNMDPEDVTNMLNDDYDLFLFDQNEEEEWRNYKYENQQFNLTSGQGYLYASSTNRTLTFTGAPYNGNGEVMLRKVEDMGCSGINLVGNPFSVPAYVTRPCYVMNSDGSEVIASGTSTTSVNAMEGVFVVAAEDGEVMTFNTTDPSKSDMRLVLNLHRNRGNIIDRAIVNFDEGSVLPKFMLDGRHTKLYFQQDNKDFAMVNGNAQGEMPISFRASENGSYTLSINTENVEMKYLHLIDHMTGADVDLLQIPSYTFDAKTSDYASRFLIVFATGNTTADNFAFFNNGNLFVNNEGYATLQVIDITGRIISSESINGCSTINVNASTGIYMVRLVNGDNVKVQKVFVR